MKALSITWRKLFTASSDYNKFREFRKFHIERAIAFKRKLAEQRNVISGELLSKSTMYSTLVFLHGLVKATEQLTDSERWERILAHAFRSWLRGRHLRSPPRLMAPA